MEFLVIAGVIVFAAVLVLLLSKKARDEVIGICSFAVEQSISKQANKQKILELFAKEKEISNEQIRGTLGVSYRSVIRYMDELEKEGKVKQLGNTGRSVAYTLQAG